MQCRQRVAGSPTRHQLQADATASRTVSPPPGHSRNDPDDAGSESAAGGSEQRLSRFASRHSLSCGGPWARSPKPSSDTVRRHQSTAMPGCSLGRPGKGHLSRALMSEAQAFGEEGECHHPRPARARGQDDKVAERGDRSLSGPVRLPHSPELPLSTSAPYTQQPQKWPVLQRTGLTVTSTLVAELRAGESGA